MMCNMALEATMLVATEENGRKEIDIKRYCKVEKIPGGELGDCDSRCAPLGTAHAPNPARPSIALLLLLLLPPFTRI
jgi:hypothetical protein